MKLSRRAHRFLRMLSPPLLAALLWFWVLSPAPKADPDVDAATADALEAAARRWPLGDHPHGIPKEDWPPELRRLRPLGVRVHSHGVYILLRLSAGDGVRGLFVLREGSDFRPERERDHSYRLVRGRVYKYHFR
jgi:hypothetical protein